MRQVRGDAAAVPRPRALGLGTRGGRGAPRRVRLLPQALPVRGRAAQVRPAGGRRGDAARPEAEARRPAHAAALTKPQRADGPSEVAQLEVQVRAGAPASAPGGAEPLACGHDLADAHPPAGEVTVERDVSLSERDFDDVPVALEAARRPGCDHSSRLRGADCEGAEDPDVDPRMRTAGVKAEP